MKNRHILGIALLAISTIICAQSTSPTTKWHWDKGTIVVDTPARPAGQQSVLGLTAPKLETVRVGFAGLGSRGPWAVRRYCHIPGVQIVALCDYEESRARDTIITSPIISRLSILIQNCKRMVLLVLFGCLIGLVVYRLKTLHKVQTL